MLLLPVLHLRNSGSGVLLCPRSKLRYDYTVFLTVSHAVGDICFEIYGVFLVEPRFVCFFMHPPACMNGRKTDRSAQTLPFLAPFRGARKRETKNP